MIVLDTHAWVWWVSQSPKLGKRAISAIADSDRIGVPAICCWEFVVLVSKGRLVIPRPAAEWLDAALSLPRVELLPLTASIALASDSLGSRFPGDPADRLIAGTAVVHGAPLATRDRRIRKAPGLTVVW